MPKIKGKSVHSRRASGDPKKSGKGWHVAQEAKEQAATAEPRATTAAPAAAEPAPRKKKPVRLSRTAMARPPPAEQKTDVKAVGWKKRKRHMRDKQGGEPADDSDTAGTAKTRKLAAAMAALPKSLGATAQGRHSAFARESGNADAARQAAERSGRKAAEPLNKLLKKGQVAQAAAVLGGLARAPQNRGLLKAAGLRLDEDVELDSQLIDNLGALAGDAVRGKGNKS